MPEIRLMAFLKICPSELSGQYHIFMQCPYCKSTNSEVVETRVSEDGTNIRRRRNCLSCGKRYTTYERIENVTLIVQKKDGKREQFDREKLRAGITRACEKT